MTLLQTGIIGTSLKDNEKRVPIHPDHFQAIAPEIRAQLTKIQKQNILP